MSQDNCPRCGHQGEASGIKDYGTAKYWGCGTWQGESGAIYVESELCLTRQELQSLKRLIRENLDYAADGRDWKGEVTKYVIYPETANEIYEATK